MIKRLSTRNERLRRARLSAGYTTAAEAAAAHGWKESAYRHHENGTSGFRLERAEEYAKAYDVPLDWLLFGHGPAPTLERLEQRVTEEVDRQFAEYRSQRFKGAVEDIAQDALDDAKVLYPFGIEHVSPIPVVGEVQAGIWQEPIETDLMTEPLDRDSVIGRTDIELLPIAVPGYARVKLFALRVRGPSMNMYYPDGRYVIAADPGAVGLRNGDHVVVRRNRAGLIETTLKELRENRGAPGVTLWPRSTDPAFQTPIVVMGDEADQDRPIIAGVVIADFGKRHRPDEPAVIRFETDHAE